MGCLCSKFVPWLLINVLNLTLGQIEAHSVTRKQPEVPNPTKRILKYLIVYMYANSGRDLRVRQRRYYSKLEQQFFFFLVQRRFGSRGSENSTRIIVSNLADTVSETDVEDLFSEFGNFSKARLLQSAVTFFKLQTNLR